MHASFTKALANAPDKPDGTIYGRVTGRDGLPVSGARLILPPDAGRLIDGGVLGTTDDDGNYTILDVPEGRYRLTCEAPTIGSISHWVSVQPGERVEMNFTAQGVRLFGAVRKGGRPLTHVKVTFAPEHGSDGDSCEATTDDSGAYEAFGVPSCPLRVSVDGMVDRFTVPSGVDEWRHDIDLLEGTISGHVYNGKTRAPVSGAKVDASFAVDPRLDLSQAASRFVKGATTGADGAFLLEGMPDGEYTLRARCDDPLGAGTVSSVVLPSGGYAGGVDITLERGAQIKAMVLDARGEPIAAVSFTLRDAASRSPIPPSEVASVYKDDSGYLHIPGVPTGTVLLTAHANGYANLTQVVEVTDSGATIEMRMSPEGRIHAHVFDGAGKPVPRAGLVVRDAQGNPVDPSLDQFSNASLLQSDAQGYVARGGLSTGHYTGEAASSAGRGAFECDVVEGETTEIEIHFQEVK